MKSIAFTHFKGKILNHSKKQTIRLLMIPTYQVGEVVNLVWKENGERVILGKGKITELFPIKIGELTLQDAIMDGFKSQRGLLTGLAKINGWWLKSKHDFKPGFKEHYCFVIRWNPLFPLKLESEEQC